jgi:hypothetical protein
MLIGKYMTNLMKKVVAVAPWSGSREPLSDDLAEFKFSFLDFRWGGLAPRISIPAPRTTI